jgi:Bacteriophage Mu transposase.
MTTVSTKRIGEAIGLTRKAVIERSRREGWAYVEKSGGLQFLEPRLPIDIRMALSATRNVTPKTEQDSREDAIAGHGYKAASERAREIATWRAALLAEFDRAKLSGVNLETFVETYNSGAVARPIMDKLGTVSVPTLYRWLRDRKETRGASGLVPRYATARSGAGESLTETERSYLECFWLRPEQPSVRHAWRLMKYNIPDSSCSYQTAYRYLRSLPQPLIDFKRLGATRAGNYHMPHVIQDIMRYRSMDKVVSDHHCLDCVIRWTNGKLIRPWITTFQDYRSGKILGWCPSVNPSSMSIIAAYYMMALRYGIPKEGVFDNGQDYRSKILNGSFEKATVYTPEGLPEETIVYLEGVFALVGTKIIFTETYNGKSKGRQERFFRTLAEYFSKDSGSYTGSDTRTRPDEVQTFYRSINGIAKREDFPDWNWFVNALGGMIQLINDSFESEGKGMNGKTPSQVFAENFPDDVPAADKEVLTLALSRGSVRRVRGNCVKIGDRSYFAQDLFRYSGRDVIVRQQLTTDSEVLICDPHGAVICVAIADYTKETEDLGETIGRVRLAKKKNLMMLAEMGSGEVVAAPEFRTMIDVAGGIYAQNGLIDLDEQLALPKAAGAESLSGKTEAEKPRMNKRTLINPLDARAEDYLPDL